LSKGPVTKRNILVSRIKRKKSVKITMRDLLTVIQNRLVVIADSIWQSSTHPNIHQPLGLAKRGLGLCDNG